jgi:hypothetical protein
MPVRSRCPDQPPRSFTVLERSIDRADSSLDAKFKPLALGEIQAADDSEYGELANTSIGLDQKACFSRPGTEVCRARG